MADKQTTLTPSDAGKPSVFDGGVKGDQRAPVKPGLGVPGTIVAVGDGIYTISIDGSTEIVANCKCMVGICAGLLGYRTTIKFGLGDHVMVIPGSPSFFVATGSRDVADTQNGDSRTHTGYPSAEAMRARDAGRNHTPPNDLVTGEFEIANLLGMAFVACQGMMAMKAQDRAKIEVFLKDGLVRLVSENYRHHSALGDLEIFNDGRLNCVFEGTSYPHEAWGALNKGDDLPVELKGAQVNLDNEKAAVETLRARFSAYVGWLGDFVHTFVTDPHRAAAEIGAEGWRSGRGSFWQGNDGSMLMQACGAEICSEVVVRMPIPRRKVRHDDSSGNKPGEFDDLDTKWLKMWQSKPEKIHETCFQLREYARWFNQAHALQRFRMASKDWEIPTEQDTPAPDRAGFEEDRKNAIGELEMVDAYACIRIMRDGSIVIRSATGSAVTMAGVDMYISAARHLIFEAGADIRFISGRNIILKARRSLEMMAIKGGITLFAKTWWKGFCQQGSLWLRSDAVDPNKDGETIPEPEEGDPAPEVLPHAVYIHASKGRSLVRSAREIRIKTEQAADTEEPGDTSASIVLESASDVINDSARNIRITARKGFLALTSTTVTAIKSGKLLVRATFADFMRSFTYKGGDWTLATIHANTVKARSIIGGRCGYQAEPEARVGAHTNHVGLLPDDYEKPEAEDEDLEEWDAIEEASRTAVVGMFPKGAPAWGFEKPTAYVLAGEEFYETLTQQELNTMENPSYENWDFAADQVSGAEIDSSRSKPWSPTLSWRHRGGDSLNKPSSSEPVFAPTSWTQSAPSFKYHKTTE